MCSTTLSPLTCACDNKLGVAEAELREKSKRYPTLADAYGHAALEIARVRHRHFRECQSCQAVDDAGPVVTGAGARA